MDILQVIRMFSESLFSFPIFNVWCKYRNKIVCLFVCFLLGIGIFDLVLPASNSDKNMIGDDL